MALVVTQACARIELSVVVAVNRKVKYRTVLLEHSLRTIPVVHVPINNEGPL